MADNTQIHGADNTSGPFTVALTGGIAAGKTEVSDRFAALGVHVIDTDRIAHQLVEPGQEVLARVVEAFGVDILDESGHLRRRRLREMVFSDSGQRQRLEEILHPAIMRETLRALDDPPGPYSMVVIPLLVEVGVQGWIDRVLLVDVDETTQLRRVMQRDDINGEQARAMLNAQSSRAQRLAIADDVIDNSGSLEDLQAQVESLHSRYLGAAGSKP